MYLTVIRHIQTLEMFENNWNNWNLKITAVESATYKRLNWNHWNLDWNQLEPRRIFNDLQRAVPQYRNTA